MVLADYVADTRRNWEGFAQVDPMWAILTGPKMRAKWDQGEFMASGEVEVANIFATLECEKVSVLRGRALDFGCGLGRLTLPLARRFDSAVGVDIAEGMVCQAREIGADVASLTYVNNPMPDLKCFGSGHLISSCRSLLCSTCRSKWLKDILRNLCACSRRAESVFFRCRPAARCPCSGVFCGKSVLSLFLYSGNAGTGSDIAWK